MADLQYGDVQRAVQDNMRQVQNDLQRLVSDMQRAVQQIQYTDETMHMVQDVQRMLQQLQPSIESMNRRITGSNTDQRLSAMQNDIQELKNRFSVIERFAGQMSEYVRQQYENDREDREYRGN